MAKERTLKEYVIPSTKEPRAIIVYPMVESNNFEIKPALLNLVQQNQFCMKVRLKKDIVFYLYDSRMKTNDVDYLPSGLINV